jgi:hypothetical protein
MAENPTYRYKNLGDVLVSSRRSGTRLPFALLLFNLVCTSADGRSGLAVLHLFGGNGR